MTRHFPQHTLNRILELLQTPLGSSNPFPRDEGTFKAGVRRPRFAYLKQDSSARAQAHLRMFPLKPSKPHMVERARACSLLGCLAGRSSEDVRLAPRSEAAQNSEENRSRQRNSWALGYNYDWGAIVSSVLRHFIIGLTVMHTRRGTFKEKKGEKTYQNYFFLLPVSSAQLPVRNPRLSWEGKYSTDEKKKK